jgi:hypothetical protein
MMLFYAAERNSAVNVLENIVSEKLPVHKVMHCTTMDTLERRLRQPRQDLEIILISVKDAIEMAHLTELRPLLLDLRLLLVLPKRDNDIIAWAHKLGPRFIAYADNGVTQVAAVLDKMLMAQRPHELAVKKDLPRAQY